MTLQMLILRYATFAGVPKNANLTARQVVLRPGETDGRFAAASVGLSTVGLAIKILLDKRWSFSDVETDVKRESRKFSLCLVLGLSVVCVAKYQLCRCFGFTYRQLATST
jgi:putative flippase GtrA